MSRLHSTLIALVIGAAATSGVYAAINTVQLGQKATAPSISTHDLAARRAKLAAWHRSLHATLAKHPPALPKLPHFAPVATHPASSPPAVSAQQPVTYVRAPTVVEYKHAPGATTTTTSSWSEDDSADDGGSSDDGAQSGGGD